MSTRRDQDRDLSRNYFLTMHEDPVHDQNLTNAHL